MMLLLNNISSEHVGVGVGDGAGAGGLPEDLLFVVFTAKPLRTSDAFISIK